MLQSECILLSIPKKFEGVTFVSYFTKQRISICSTFPSQRLLDRISIAKLSKRVILSLKL